MRIHTDKPGAVGLALYAAAHSLPGVGLEYRHTGSRSHESAIELHLTGTSTRRTNPGTGGGERLNAATWDEWGVVLQAMFDADPNAVAGSVKRPTYASKADYEYQTSTRFVDGMPDDTHQDHRWILKAAGVHACTKCTAVRRYDA